MTELLDTTGGAINGDVPKPQDAPPEAVEWLNLRVWAITGRYVDVRTRGPWAVAVAVFKAQGMILAERGCIPWEAIGYIEVLPESAGGTVLSLVPGGQPG